MPNPMIGLQDQHIDNLFCGYQLVNLKFHIQADPELAKFFPKDTLMENGFYKVVLNVEELADDLIPLARLFTATQEGAKLISLSRTTKG